MSARHKKQKFALIEIAPFDARHGYKRCTIEGLGNTLPVDSSFPWLRPTRVDADFWRNRTGGLVVRFSSSDHNVFHYEALLANGKPVPEEDIEDFCDFIREILDDWGGTADHPEEFI